MTKFPSCSFVTPVRLVLPLCAALLVSSCSLLRQSQTEAPSLPQIAATASHLAQMNFGHQAEFGLCTPPVCPAVTPKTLPASPVPRPPSATSTLSAGEEIIPPSSPSSPKVPSPFRRSAESTSRTVAVHFKFDDASLSAADKVALDSAVAATPHAKHIVISGRTDSIGPASAVSDYLRTAHPHLAPVLKLDAQGACCYVEPNDTEQSRSRNRRVDVLFSSEGEQQP